MPSSSPSPAPILVDHCPAPVHSGCCLRFMVPQVVWKGRQWFYLLWNATSLSKLIRPLQRYGLEGGSRKEQEAPQLRPQHSPHDPVKISVGQTHKLSPLPVFKVDLLAHALLVCSFYLFGFKMTAASPGSSCRKQAEFGECARDLLPDQQEMVEIKIGLSSPPQQSQEREKHVANDD